MRLNSWLANLFRKLTRQNLRVGRQKRSSNKSYMSECAMVQELEPRQLLSAAPFAVITVTTTSDAYNDANVTAGANPTSGIAKTLREAINYENQNGGGATIQFASNLSGGTITLAQGALSVSKSMTINGLGANQLTISGNNASQIFVVDDAAITTDQVTISNLTVTNGFANGSFFLQKNGGAISNFENLTLSNDVISNNVTLGYGGGIYNGSTLTCTNDTIAGNSSLFGGGIYNLGTLTSSSNTISGNTVKNGSGGGVANAGTMYSTNDTIAQNSVTGSNFGGGIANFKNLTTTYDTIANNYDDGVYTTFYWNTLNTIVAGNFSAVGSTTQLDVVNATYNSSTNQYTLAINANSTLIGVANSAVIGDTTSAAGIEGGVNGNIVGVPTNRIFVTNVSGMPLLTNNGGPTKTIALVASSPANGTNPAIGAGTALDTLAAGGLDAVSTTLNATSGIFIEVGDYLLIDSEIVLVTAKLPTSYTIARGEDGTTAAVHSASAPIQLVLDQRGYTRGIVNDLGSVDFEQAPIIVAPARAYVFENTSFTFAANAIVLNDAEYAGNLDTLSLSVTNGTLTLGPTTGLTIVSGANGSSSVTVAGSLANLNAAMVGLVYTPTAGFSGSDSLAIQFQNSLNNLTASTNVAISVLPLSPSFAAPQSVSVNENSSLNFAGKNAISVSDPIGTAEQVTVSVMQGTLLLGSTTGLNVVGNGTNSITFNGALSDVNAALGTLSYTPTSGYHGPDVLVLQSWDMVNNLTGSSNVNISVNPIPPSIAAPSSVSVNQNGVLPFTAGNTISVSDVSGTSEKMTLTVLHGTLNLGSTTGLTVTGNGTSSLILTGSLVSFNAALATLIYAPLPGFHGVDTLSMTVRDTTTNLMQTVGVGITVNQLPPAIVAPLFVNASENAVTSFTFGNAISIMDVNVTGEQLTLSVQHGNLRLGNTTGLNVAGNGTNTVTFNGSLAAINAALASLTYTPATGYVGPDTLNVQAWDFISNLTAQTSVGMMVS
jgi:hypothetical protein